MTPDEIFTTAFLCFLFLIPVSLCMFFNIHSKITRKRQKREYGYYVGQVIYSNEENPFDRHSFEIEEIREGWFKLVYNNRKGYRGRDGEEKTLNKEEFLELLKKDYDA